MDNTGNRTEKLAEFLNTLGIEINIGKNKARGNKGFFKAGREVYRIDISKGLTESEKLSVISHEFAHYLHYKTDKNFNPPRLILGDIDDTLTDEMIELTVDSIPKSSVSPLFEKLEILKQEIKELKSELKVKNPDIAFAKPCKSIELKLKRLNLHYLLKYDRVKFPMFNNKILAVDNIGNQFPDIDSECILYLKLKSKQRAIKRINSKINKLNKYYNSPSELFARAFSAYITDRRKMEQKAPKLLARFDNAIKNPKLSVMKDFINIAINNS